MADETQELRRVGIIGDVHAEDAALEAVISFLRDQSDLDALLCTGDIIDGEGDTNRCCELLREANVLTVRGNHDRWFFELEPHRTPDHPHHAVTQETRAFLATLPATRDFQTPYGPLLLCHGLGTDDMVAIYPSDEGYALGSNHQLHALAGQGHYRFVINGHTHCRMVRTIDQVTILNAGTLQWAYGSCFCIADFAAGAVQFYDIDTDSLAIREAEMFALPAPDKEF